MSGFCIDRALCLLLLASCHPNQTLTPPPTTDARAVLLMVKGADYLALHGIEVGEATTTTFPVISHPEEVDLYAVQYTCGLSTLGLAPGKQALLDEPSASLRLPSAQKIFHASVGATTQSAWVEEPMPDVVTEALSRLSLPEDNLCQIYSLSFGPQGTPFYAGTSSGSAFIQDLGDETALVGTLDGLFFTLDLSGRLTPITSLSTTTPHRGAYRSLAGELFLVGDDGRIARGDLSNGFQLMPGVQSATVSTWLDLAGPRDVGAPFELFSADRERYFERFDGTEWQTLKRGLYQGFARHNTVTWVGPNEAFATGVSDAGHAIVHYKDGVVTEDLIDSRSLPWVVQHVPGIGTFVGTKGGEIARWEEGEWRLQGKVQDSILAIMPTTGGFLFGAIRFGQYHELAGFCPLSIETIRASEIVRLGDKLVIRGSGGISYRGGLSLVPVMESPGLDCR